MIETPACLPPLATGLTAVSHQGHYSLIVYYSQQVIYHGFHGPVNGATNPCHPVPHWGLARQTSCNATTINHYTSSYSGKSHPDQTIHYPHISLHYIQDNNHRTGGFWKNQLNLQLPIYLFGGAASHTCKTQHGIFAASGTATKLLDDLS